MTLIELLVVITIIAVLIGLLLPAIAMVRQRANRSQAQERVTQLHWALQNYASEDRRHRYPPQMSPTDFTITWDPSNTTPGNFNALIATGHKVDLGDFDREASPPYPLLDPWGKPFQYKVDDDLLGASTPQRPLPLEGWNTAGARPWAYIWSVGRDQTTNGTGWIYQRDDT